MRGSLRFNPNIEKDLLFLFSEKLFSGPSIEGYSIDHKDVVLKMLADALNDPEYDFEGIIFDEEDEYFCLPFEWDIEDPRFFFEVAYKAAFNHWGDELIKSNRKVLHPNVCTKN
ncbi:hypothetical protein [uncultured Shewanella sp.]|uniref:hypothetical protein n=1 Tax=uncultured Shewanella sp. TaxID=173975 RepID=UPI0026236F06|nr:hypothetical protein [uncultured Shewanella sp.]